MSLVLNNWALGILFSPVLYNSIIMAKQLGHLSTQRELVSLESKLMHSVVVIYLHRYISQ